MSFSGLVVFVSVFQCEYIGVAGAEGGAQAAAWYGGDEWGEEPAAAAPVPAAHPPRSDKPLFKFALPKEFFVAGGPVVRWAALRRAAMNTCECVWPVPPGLQRPRTPSPGQIPHPVHRLRPDPVRV